MGAQGPLWISKEEPDPQLSFLLSLARRIDSQERTLGPWPGVQKEAGLHRMETQRRVRDSDLQSWRENK